MRAAVLAAFGALLVSACIQLSARDPSSILEKCRDEARGAYYGKDASPNDAYDAYDKCVEREGL